MSRPRVFAVVVTFDRPAVLRRCLDALASQSRPPDTILVVDNGSSAETAELLRRETERGHALRVLRLDENLGPAGGFAAGLHAALKSNCTHAWPMDDDVVAEPGCLEALLQRAASTGEEVVFPTVVGPQGQILGHPGWNAVLLAASSLRRAGMPDDRLFWWIEDTEFLQWRLPHHGARVGRSSRARARHQFSRSRHKPPWKYYYEVRNTLYYRLWVQDTSWRRRGSRIAAVVIRAVGRALLRDPHKVRCLIFVGRGVWDGLRRDLGKNVDPARG